MGIEPTRDLLGLALVLKTRSTTRHLSPPRQFKRAAGKTYLILTVIITLSRELLQALIVLLFVLLYPGCFRDARGIVLYHHRSAAMTSLPK